MTTTVRRPARRSGRASEVTGPPASAVWAWTAVVAGLVILLAGLFLLMMFVSMALGYGTEPWGPINDVLAAAGNLMLAALVVYTSQRAVRGWPSAAFVWLVAAASVTGAVAGLALVGGVLPLETSSIVTVAATALQMIWLLWLGRRFARDEDLPRDLTRLAQVFPVTLLLGGALAGASLLFPWGSFESLALLGPGAVLGGVTWLMWPFWLVLLGRHLLGRRRRRPGPTGIAEAAR